MCRLLYIQLEVEAWACINCCVSGLWRSVIIIHSTRPCLWTWPCVFEHAQTVKERGEESKRGKNHKASSLPCSCSPASPSICTCMHLSDIYVGMYAVIACGPLRGSNLWIFFHGTGPPSLFSTRDPTSFSVTVCHCLHSVLWSCPIKAGNVPIVCPAALLTQ